MRQMLRSLTWLFPVFIALSAFGCGPGPDVTVPTLNQILVNDGSPYTLTRTIIVTASCSDNEGVSAIMISEDPSFADGVWQDFEEEIQFDLSAGDGSKALYVKVKDSSDNESSVVSAEIFMAETTTIVGLSPYATSASSYSLELWIANVTDMYSGVFQLSFDPELVEVDSLAVDISDHILKTTGASLIVSNRTYDNVTGEVHIGALPQQSGFEGITGGGPFARIFFTPKQTLSANAAVEFVEGEWTALYAVQESGPPAIISNVVFFDGEIEPQ